MTGHLCGKTLLVLETTVICVSYVVVWKGNVIQNTKTQYFTLLIFLKVFCTFASCFKMGSQGRLLKYAFESGHMFDGRKLGVSSILEAY